ncbi:hypothetical protein D3C80_1886960 [compost metagenome]
MLSASAGDQLAEAHVALELVQLSQLVELCTQPLQAFEQLALVGGADQVELAGRLVTGDACDGLRLLQQLR